MTTEEQKRTSDLIADTLIAEIKQGTLHVGDPIPTERELCERFDASRTVVREALLKVQVSGYVDVSAGRRPRAAKPSVTEVIMAAAGSLREILGDSESTAQLEQVRLFLECGAIREATEKATNIQIAKMKSALEDNYNAIGTDEFPITDVAFHRSIISVIGNSLILTLYDNFVDAMVSKRPHWQNQEEHDRLVYKEHHAIYETILGGNSVEATNLMHGHLERSYRSRLLAPDPNALK